MTWQSHLTDAEEDELKALGYDRLKASIAADKASAAIARIRNRCVLRARRARENNNASQ